MSKTPLIVHIGANKTGSSAIQSFLALNHQTLANRQILVPPASLALGGRVVGSHVWKLQEFLDDANGPAKMESAMAAYVGDKTVILSAENLAEHPAAPLLFSRLTGTFDIRVLVYIRRQDEYLLSSWQQWYSKIADDFWAWALSTIGTMGNWRTVIQAWSTVTDRVSVRVFERPRLWQNDVVTDFCRMVGIEVAGLEWPRAPVNPSFSEAVMDLVAGNKLIFADAHDNEFYHLVQKLTGDHYLKSGKSALLTHQQRVAILRRYSEPNQWVKQRYFPHDPLFSPPRAEDCVLISEENRVREQLRFLTAMLYRMSKVRPSG